MAKVYKVFLDAGHGGSDPGAVSHKLQEKDITLAITLACRDELKKYKNVQVECSRTRDVDTSLNGLCQTINDWGADVAVSIHINAGGGDGCEAWIAQKSPKSNKLAKAILNEIVKAGQTTNRGIKTKKDVDGSDYFGFNRMPNCPSPIIESFFIDSNDRKFGDTKAKQKKLGIAIATGIAKYLGLKKIKVYPTYRTLHKMNIRANTSIKSKKQGALEKGELFKVSKVTTTGWGQLASGKGYVRIRSGIKAYCQKVK